MPFTNETEEKQVERAVLVGLSCPGFNADQAADERTMDDLLAAIEKALGKGKHRVKLCIPYSDGAVLDMLHREAQIESTDYAAEGTVIEAVVDDKTCGRVSAYIIDNE